jgi:hypothetical protein
MHFVAKAANEDGDGVKTGDHALLPADTEYMSRLASKDQKGLGHWRRWVPSGSDQVFP